MTKTRFRSIFKTLVLCFGFSLLFSGCTRESQSAENLSAQANSVRSLVDIKNDTIECADGSSLILNFDGDFLQINRTNNDEDEMQYLTFYQNGKLKEMTSVDGAEWKQTKGGEQRTYNMQKISIDSLGDLQYALVTRNFEKVLDTIWKSEQYSTLYKIETVTSA